MAASQVAAPQFPASNEPRFDGAESLSLIPLTLAYDPIEK